MPHPYAQTIFIDDVLALVTSRFATLDTSFAGLPPTVFLDTPSGRRAAVLPWSDQHQGELAAHVAFAELLTRFDVRGCGLLLSCWMGVGEGELLSRKPSEQPRRRQALHMRFCCADGSDVRYLAFVDRDGERAPRLNDWELLRGRPERGLSTHALR
jgi:hypothetical protein